MKRRILFVADAGSSHVAQWLRFFRRRGDWDVHVFTTGTVPADPVPATIHVLGKHQRGNTPNRVRAWWPFPFRRGLGRAYRLMLGPYPDGEPMRLARLIRRLRPHIVHSMRMQDEAYLTFGAREAIREVGAKWVLSTWGSDLFWFGRDPAHTIRIREVIGEVDTIICDCARDLGLSASFGARPEQLFSHVIPTTGGLDLAPLREMRERREPTNRHVVLLPKTQDGQYARATPIIEAIVRIAERHPDDRFILLRADQVIRERIGTFPDGVRRRFEVHESIPHADALELAARARVMAAPSVSDGTPNCLLEAMALGALPIMSPLESVREWITNGENGLLAEPENVAALTAVLDRALSDDALVRRAAEANWDIVSARASREVHGPVILDMYDRLADGALKRTGIDAVGSDNAGIKTEVPRSLPCAS